MSNKKITFEDLSDMTLSEGVWLKTQEKHWMVNINHTLVSVVKWNPGTYNGDYEIWSNEKLFPDVERYATMEEVLIRLTELESKNG